MHSKRRIIQTSQAYIFLSPFLLMVTVFYVLPSIFTIVMSFSGLDRSFVWEFVGFKNYAKIFQDPNTSVIVWNTIAFVGITIILTVLLQLVLATVTTHLIKNDNYSNIFKIIIMIPMITPTVVYSVLWIWLLDASANGVVNELYIKATGKGPINWIANYPFVVIIVTQVMTSIAYGLTIFSSAIRSIPEVQFRAARVDGAGEIQIFLNIIIPNLKSHISFVALWEILGLLTNYINIMLITNGGPGIRTEVWALSAYHKAFGDGEYGHGAAISVMLIFVVVILMTLLLKMARAKKGEINVQQ